MREERTKNSMNVKMIAIAVVVYVASSLVSFIAFSQFGIGSVATPIAQPKKTADGRLLFDPSLPRTEPCPLNGALYSKQQRAWWEKHGPLGVMIENHVEARPQSGLSSADIIYEAVAEGGITRFLAMYYCQDAEFVGPVRSARTYFLDFISEFGPFPLYAHVGGANTPGPANALGQIDDYGWSGYNDLNQFSIGFPVFVRDYDRLGRTVATEHTVYSSTTQLWDYAKEKRDLTNVDEDGNQWDEDFTPYKFKDDAAESARPAAQTITFDFWKGYSDFTVSWKYDRATNSYLRSQGGEPHTDLNTKKQLSSKNVVILFMRESRANDGYEGNLHMLYGTKGTGNVKVFLDGEEIDGTWSKRTRTDHLSIKDNRGNDIELNKGQIWFHVVAPGTEINVN